MTILLAGCASRWQFDGQTPWMRPQESPREIGKEPLSTTADLLVLKAGYWCGIPGPMSNCEWVLKKAGRCHGKLVTGSNIHSSAMPTQTFEYELPCSVFEEALEMIERADFRHMKPVFRPCFGFEASTYCVEIHYNGKVGVTSSTSPDVLFDFVMGLKNKGTILKPEVSPESTSTLE